MIEKYYCLNLETEMLRRNFITEQFEKLNIYNYEFVKAYNSQSPEVEKLYNKYNKNFISIENKAQIAISLGHLEIAKKIYENKYTCCAILEDDIKIKENYNDILSNYLTDKILEKLETEPCLLHMACGPNLKSEEAKLYKLDHIVGICFNIMNYQMAELIIKNYEPLEFQFDTYLHFLCKNNRITELVAVPLLGYDLSSKMYKKLWSQEDLEFHKKIKSLSK